MIDEILSRLQKVRKTGSRNWLACCPAHEDRHPSMTICEAEDGRTLVDCKAGCEFSEIVDAVGLPMAAWFKHEDKPRSRLPRPMYPAADVLEALAFETTLVAVAACNLANGVVLTPEDKARILVAYERIQAGRDMALGKR